MFKKINKYHFSLLISIVFILNTILFRPIYITQGQQFKPPTVGPGGGTGASIVTSPLSADLDLGGYNIFGEGNININGGGYFSGPIGIGITTELGRTFEVNGDAQFRNHLYIDDDDGDSPHLRFTNQAGGDADIFMKDNHVEFSTSKSDDSIVFQPIGGKVSIGTTEPGETLTVQSADTIDTDIVVGRFQHGHANGGGLEIRTRRDSLDGWANYAMIQSKPNDEQVNRFLILQPDGGNIGIGTTEPNKNLHIYDTREGDFNAEINLQSIVGNGNHWGIYHDWESDDLRFWNEDDILTITGEQSPYGAGNVGIGTSTPPRRLSVWNGSILTQQSDNTNNFGWQIYTRAENSDVAGNLTFHENTEENFNGAHRVTLERGGNVGIGIEDPTVKLHVGGIIASNNMIIGEQFGGNWNGYDWKTSKYYDIPFGGTAYEGEGYYENDDNNEFYWDFPVTKFGFPGHQGIVRLLIQNWASEYWYGLIMWKNSGGADPIKEAFAIPVVEPGQPSTQNGDPVGISVSVPNPLGWSDAVVDGSELENIVRIHFSGMWGHSHAGTMKLLFDR